MTHLENNYKFLLNSRKGFYCSLCDSNNNSMFDSEKNEMIVSPE